MNQTITLTIIASLVVAVIPSVYLYSLLVQIQEENKALQADLDAASNDRDTARAEVAAFAATIKDFEHDIKILDAENQILQAAVQRHEAMTTAREEKKRQPYRLGSIRWN